jgi:hypothetical protein
MVLIPDSTDQSAITRAYAAVLQWALGHRWGVVALAMAAFMAGLLLIPLVPTGFIPKLDRGEFNITFIRPLPERSNQAAPTLPSDLASLPQRTGSTAPRGPGQGDATGLAMPPNPPAGYPERQPRRGP